MNARAGDGEGGDAGPRRTAPRGFGRVESERIGASRSGACVVATGGGKASKGRRASRGTPFRDGGKRGEPQDRQRDEKSPRRRGGGSRRGGEKPRGRNVGGDRQSPLRRPAGPRERERRRRVPRGARPRACERPAGSGLHDVPDGGAFFGQPQERKPGVVAGPQGPGRAGKGGAKVQEGHRVAADVATPPDRGVLEGQPWRHGEGRGGHRRTARSRNVDRVFPPRRRTRSRRACREARPCARARPPLAGVAEAALRHVARGKAAPPVGGVGP